MPTLRDIGGYLLDPMSAVGDFARYTTGDLLFPAERTTRAKERQPEYLRRAPVAALGQRYQNYPAATFDERFGPFGLDQQQLEQLLLQQMRPQPGQMIPGE